MEIRIATTGLQTGLAMTRKPEVLFVILHDRRESENPLHAHGPSWAPAPTAGEAFY